MAYLYDLTDTWNAAGTVFNAIKMNVTNSASAAGSKIVSLQVGSTDRFTVDKDGNGYFSGTLQAVGAISFPNAYLSGNSGTIGMQDNTSSILAYNGTGSGGITNTLRFITGASERMRIDGSGNVGIGASSPSGKLTIKNPSASGDQVILNVQAATSTTSIGRISYNQTDDTMRLFNESNYSGSSLLFGVNNTERMRIDYSGNVGIGTASPSQKLDVNGAIKGGVAAGVTLLMADSSAIRNTASGGNTMYFDSGVGSGSTTGDFNFRSTASYTSRLYIDGSTGRVGIGTTSPGARLQVQDTETTVRLTATSGRIWDLVSGGGGNVGANFFAIRDTSSGANVVQIAPQASEAMRIDASGRVGIGTSSPGYKLVVNGGDFLVSRGSGATAADAAINFGGNANNYIYSGNSSNIMAFATNGSERMRINSDGNVGIGTSSIASLLHVKLGSNATEVYPSGTWATRVINAVDGAANNGLLVGNRWAGTTSTAFEVGSIFGGGTGSWFSYYRIDGVGQSIWSNQGIERMRLDTSGNLMLNTTTAVQPLTIGSGSATAAGINLRTTQTDFSITASNSAAGGVTIGTSWVSGGQGPLIFTQAAGERMRINSSGEVLMGTSIGGRAVCMYASDMWLRLSNASRQWLIGPSIGSSFNIWDETGGANRFYIDSTGAAYFNVGGVSNTHQFLYNESGGEIQLVDSTGAGPILIDNSGGLARFLKVGSGSMAIGTTSTGFLRFQTADIERARITSSGNFLVGTTSPAAGNWSHEIKDTTTDAWPLALNATTRGMVIRNSSASSGYYAYFEYNGGTNNGSISWSGGTTAYNTTSDARIKENIVDAPEAGSLIDNIKVRSWDFKADGNHWRYGMVAQELLEVAPEAVSVPEDEEQMMGVDYSKLVPMLIKEVQSLRARVAQLEGN